MDISKTIIWTFLMDKTAVQGLDLDTMLEMWLMEIHVDSMWTKRGMVNTEGLRKHNKGLSLYKFVANSET